MARGCTQDGYGGWIQWWVHLALRVSRGLSSVTQPTSHLVRIATASHYHLQRPVNMYIYVYMYVYMYMHTCM